VIDAGAMDMITPVPATSDDGAWMLEQLGVRADLVYIDGSHRYEVVARDLRAYWPLVADSGFLFGDDYQTHPEVGRAADEFARELGIPLRTDGNKFILDKSAGAGAFFNPAPGAE